MNARVQVRALDLTLADQPILQGIELTVGPGERVGVIGPNGSGKSTLLRCLYAWYKPSSGAVLLNDATLSDLTPRQRAQIVAVMTQEAETGLGLTAAEVIELGRLPHGSGGNSSDAVIAQLDLKTLARRPFTTLSGGEKQRVLFARALMQSPRLLILDEPTNHLDIRHQLEILDLTRRLEISVVAALHDLNLAASWCDRLCLLECGRVRALGTPEEVLDPALIGEVYGVGVDRDRDPRTGRPRLSFYPVS